MAVSSLDWDVHENKVQKILGMCIYSNEYQRLADDCFPVCGWQAVNSGRSRDSGIFSK